ncbi:MAG: hypothetical protein M3033_11405, partial [Acidobacteriota bacterium]|nr:hypothetical protein [Acidobacteriota bacterium]
DKHIKRIEPTATPMFMKDMLEIKIQKDDHYWKVPNQNDYTSWLPQVSFDVFFDNSTKMRYQAEWFNPDGSPWFTESLDAGNFSEDSQTIRVSSPYSGDLLNTKAVTTTGTYGVKITNVKTSETVFQGKFKVNKMSLADGDARLKNKFLFYVDNDWTLPIGYVGFTYSGETSWNTEVEPLVFMWFKGELQAKDMEARLFYNNQQVASTDDGGFNNTTQTRGEGCFLSKDICYYKLWEFSWKNFFIENSEYAGAKRPNVIYTEDKPGEYTVKVFYKGAQVREAKFTIDRKGWIAPNQFSDKIFLTEYKIVVPVKIMGTLDKWNAAAWKTDAFYGNPLAGFNVQ